MEMNRDSITVEDYDGDYLVVLCDFGGVARDWPPRLEHRGYQYKFDTQLTLDTKQASTYAGRARYKYAR